MNPRKNPSNYYKIWLWAIGSLVIFSNASYAQDTSKSMLNLNQNKLVKKVNSILDSTQKKTKGIIVDKVKGINQKVDTQVNKTVSKYIPKEVEKPLPYERLLNTKYTLGRRAYQNTVSQFNYLFNAQEELKDIIQKARDNYQEDYSNLLSFYDYDLATTSKSSIDSIVYRCNANIVLHDLRSNWVDDAYLLMAKAYLFHRNFDTAASILQFINYSFDEKENGMDLPIGSNLRKTNGQFSIATKETNRAFENVNVRNESMVWQARNYFETNALNEGISLLQLLKADALFPKRLYPFLNEQLAYGYYLSESYEQAAKYLIEALANAQDGNAKSRWYFLIAQLWQKADKIENAYKWFKKANEFSPNPIIGVYSKINMVRIESKNANRPWTSLAADLEQMTKRDKYKPYIDIIYFEMAKLAIQNDVLSKANDWLVIAIKNNKSNLTQKQKAFELLGDINYQNNQFGIAKMAYDSLNAVLKTNPQFEQIVLRKKWLGTINEQTLNYQKEDSLEYIYHLPKDLQDSYGKAWAIRRATHLNNIATLFTEKNTKNIVYSEPTVSSAINMNVYASNANVSEFYFDNKNTITQGKQSFIQKWGERPNVDQWRRKTSSTIVNSAPKAVNSNMVSFAKDSSTDLKKDKLNKENIVFTPIGSEAELNKSKMLWNQAALKTAQTFLLQLNDFEKAKPIYQKIITNNIDSIITERALLDLASQYLHDGDKEKSDNIIKLVLERFPNGVYGAKKKEDDLKKDKDQNIINQYKEAYFLSQIGDWDHLSEIISVYNNEIRKTKWNIPFQFIKVKMYAQQKQDSLALVLLDSIITMNKSDIIKEKARNIITEIKNRKGTEAYLASLQIVKEQYANIAAAEVYKKDSNLSVNSKGIQNAAIIKDNPIKDSSNLKLTEQQYISPIDFSNDSTAPHFIAFVTSNIKPMFVKEMQNAFSSVNSDEFAKLKLTTSFVPFQENMYIVWIGPFENRQSSKQYLKNIKPRLNNELISFVPAKQYEMYIIEKSNILYLKTKEDLKQYKEFMINKIIKP